MPRVNIGPDNNAQIEITTLQSQSKSRKLKKIKMASGSERVVVVGVDDSAHSYHALETALDLFFIPFKANPRFKLVVLHARPTATFFLGVAGPGTVDIIPMVEEDLNKTADLVKKKCAEVCSAKSVEISSLEVIEGDPRNIMLEAVERHHACVLVLGSHGYGADVKRMFLWSVKCE